MSPQLSLKPLVHLNLTSCEGGSLEDQFVCDVSRFHIRPIVQTRSKIFPKCGKVTSHITCNVFTIKLERVGLWPFRRKESLHLWWHSVLPVSATAHHHHHSLLSVTWISAISQTEAAEKRKTLVSLRGERRHNNYFFLHDKWMCALISQQGSHITWTQRPEISYTISQPPPQK